VKKDAQSQNEIRSVCVKMAPMPILRPFDHVETFKKAIDSSLKSLQITMDEDEANRTVPIEEKEDIVRVEVEDEYEHMARLRDELVNESEAGPARFARFVEKHKGELSKILSVYEKRLKVILKAQKGKKEGHGLKLARTSEELEFVRLAKQTLAMPTTSTLGQSGRS